MYTLDFTKEEVMNLLVALNNIQVRGKDQMIVALVLIDKLEKVLQAKLEPEGE